MRKFVINQERMQALDVGFNGIKLIIKTYTQTGHFNRSCSWLASYYSFIRNWLFIHTILRPNDHEFWITPTPIYHHAFLTHYLSHRRIRPNLSFHFVRPPKPLEIMRCGKRRSHPIVSKSRSASPRRTRTRSKTPRVTFQSGRSPPKARRPPKKRPAHPYRQLLQSRKSWSTHLAWSPSRNNGRRSGWSRSCQWTGA